METFSILAAVAIPALVSGSRPRRAAISLICSSYSAASIRHSIPGPGLMSLLKTAVRSSRYPPWKGQVLKTLRLPAKGTTIHFSYR